MRVFALLLGLVGAAMLAGVFVLTAKAELTGDPLYILSQLFLDADTLAKLVLLALIPSLIFVMIVGVSGLVRRSGSPSDGLAVFSFACPLAGLAAGAYAASNTYTAAMRVHVTDFRVVAPSLAEATLVAAAGLLVGALAAGFNLARSRA